MNQVNVGGIANLIKLSLFIVHVPFIVSINLETVLQAADILLFHTTHVPVGIDQISHLNLTNSLREDFNRAFKEDYFPTGK